MLRREEKIGPRLYRGYRVIYWRITSPIFLQSVADGRSKIVASSSASKGCIGFGKAKPGRRSPAVEIDGRKAPILRGAPIDVI